MVKQRAEKDATEEEGPEIPVDVLAFLHQINAVIIRGVCVAAIFVIFFLAFLFTRGRFFHRSVGIFFKWCKRMSHFNV